MKRTRPDPRIIARDRRRIDVANALMRIINDGQSGLPTPADKIMAVQLLFKLHEYTRETT